MATTKLSSSILLLLLSFFLAASAAKELRTQLVQPNQRNPVNLQDKFQEPEGRNSRRLMIGSTRPTCTYNECKGCKYICRAEQVPVEGDDPINSAYHYKCVCHR